MIFNHYQKLNPVTNAVLYASSYTINFAFTCAKLCSHKAILNLCLKFQLKILLLVVALRQLTSQSFFTKLVYYQFLFYGHSMAIYCIFNNQQYVFQLFNKNISLYNYISTYVCSYIAMYTNHVKLCQIIKCYYRKQTKVKLQVAANCIYDC